MAGTATTPGRADAWLLPGLVYPTSPSGDTLVAHPGFGMSGSYLLSPSPHFFLSTNPLSSFCCVSCPLAQPAYVSSLLIAHPSGLFPVCAGGRTVQRLSVALEAPAGMSQKPQVSHVVQLGVAWGGGGGRTWWFSKVLNGISECWVRQKQPMT